MISDNNHKKTQITDKLNYINQIENIKKQIDALIPLSPELEQALQERLRVEWTYNSNAIEGNTLSYGETAFFLREGLTSEGKPLKDYLEAKNHANAIYYLQEIVKDKRQITENLIKEIHFLLMQDIDSTKAKGMDGRLITKPLHAGKYKTRPNHVLTLSGKIHKYTDPIHVVDEMEALIKWLKNSKALHPVERAALFHYKFIIIHPFDDGNGRLARLLMNLILMQSCLPPCIIPNKQKRSYLEKLEHADTKKDLEPFVTFVAKQLLDTMTTICDALLGGEDSLVNVSYKTLTPIEREALILKVVKDKPVAIKEIHKQLSQINKATLKKDLNRLVLENKISKQGQARATTYVLKIKK